MTSQTQPVHITGEVGVARVKPAIDLWAAVLGTSMADGLRQTDLKHDRSTPELKELVHTATQ